MNYYPFHLGDYLKKTSHLTPAEDIAYRRLLDLYYLGEGALKGHDKDLARLIRMGDQVDLVGAILREFFQLDDSRGVPIWFNSRCDEELAKYDAMRQGGRDGAERRWGKASDAPPIAPPCPPDSPPNANQNHNQNQNQRKSKTKRQREPAPAAMLPPWMPIASWEGFAEMRAKIRAPLTGKAIEKTIDDLQRLRNEGHDPAEVLDQSTQRCWRGVFPVRRDFAVFKGGKAAGVESHNAAVFDRMMANENGRSK